MIKELKNSYISPSLGISGGHLERDVFTIKKYINNENIKRIFSSLKNLNQNRISLLIRKFKDLYNLKNIRKSFG